MRDSFFLEIESSKKKMIAKTRDGKREEGKRREREEIERRIERVEPTPCLP